VGQALEWTNSQGRKCRIDYDGGMSLAGLPSLFFCGVDGWLSHSHDSSTPDLAGRRDMGSHSWGKPTWCKT